MWPLLLEHGKRLVKTERQRAGAGASTGRVRVVTRFHDCRARVSMFRLRLLQSGRRAPSGYSEGLPMHPVSIPDPDLVVLPFAVSEHRRPGKLCHSFLCHFSLSVPRSSSQNNPSTSPQSTQRQLRHYGFWPSHHAHGLLFGLDSLQIRQRLRLAVSDLMCQSLSVRHGDADGSIFLTINASLSTADDPALTFVDQQRTTKASVSSSNSSSDAVLPRFTASAKPRRPTSHSTHIPYSQNRLPTPTRHNVHNPHQRPLHCLPPPQHLQIPLHPLQTPPRDRNRRPARRARLRREPHLQRHE